MKKFISNISSTTANAVNSAVKQIDKSLTQDHHQQQYAPPSPPPDSSKQYLRLPVDSAKKLRWYDKADVAALTRQHVREKHMLLDTITALKKMMIRAGFTDAALDEEARQLVAAAEAMRLVDNGTESVLLIALQAELESVTAQRQVLEQDLQQLRDRCRELELRPEPSTPPQSTLEQQTPQRHSSSSGADTSAEEQEQEVQQQQQQEPAQQAAAAAAAEDAAADVAVGLQGKLQASYAALEAAVAAAADITAQVRAQEMLLETTNDQAVLQQLSADAADSSPPSTPQQANSSADAQQQQSQQQQQQSDKQSPAIDPSSPDVVPAAVVKRYREFIIALEERCRSAERGASLSAARVASLEESLAAAQQSLAAAQQRGAQAVAAAKQQISALEERLRTAESAAAAAAAASGPASSTAAVAAEEQLAQLQQQLAGSRMQVTNLERRLSSAEGREASLMAELRSAEAAAAERDSALAAAAALREQLGELGRERSQLEHHKQRVAGLEAAKADLEGQLSGLAALVASLEARLRDVTAQSTAASAAAELAAATAAKAQAAVAEQVAARLAAAGRNRSLWPPAAQQEVEQLEQQMQDLQATLTSTRCELEQCTRQLQHAQQSQSGLQEHLQEVEAQLIQSERDAALRVAELQSALERSQADVDNLRDTLQALEQQHAAAERMRQQQQPHNSSTLDLRRNTSLHSSGLLSASGGSGIICNASGAAGHGSNSPSRTSGKWQEQNKVGGGSLFGVADSSVEEAAALPVGSSAKREALAGVDLVYVKNVVLKFLEAVMAGKTSERDALLPAVAAVLHATPAEFAAMRKVLAATAPAGTQVMGVLGRLAQLAG